MERTAQEHHCAANRATIREARNSLSCHCGKDRGRQVLMCCALVDERLEIGLREYSAAGRDRIELLVPAGQLIQTRGVSVEQGGHLVDKRTCSARAGSIHPLFRSGMQVRDFGVFTAKFDDDVDIRVQAARCFRTRNDFLYKRHTDGMRSG